MAMRRLLTVVLLALALPALAGCRSTREDALRQFTDQLEQEGGLPRPVAECVAEKFFAARSTEDLKEFFDRVDLTEPEQAEFAQLGEECAAIYASTSTTG
jgi:hypothetical protein